LHLQAGGCVAIFSLWAGKKMDKILTFFHVEKW